MVVVFVEGVDGTGKTTLINHLVQQLPTHATITAPPLWTYLPAVPTPDAFRTWVTTTPAAAVAADLLTAQHARINALQRLSSPHEVVLVDRGPRTVAASARAHLATNSQPGPPGAADELAVELGTAVRRLTATRPCLSIELATTTYDEIMDRLTDHERRDAAYLRYLHTFLREFRADTFPTGAAQLVLAADAELGETVAAAAAAIQDVK
ncbi:hypothetical protein ACQEVZ_55225 [Dactylosporangium sp. CA-152071]|uniref:hypothetical protein n=1 Tax=Dactylosporangium sp. CA-152071 TaxID=3239933 RepID=UPI003D8B0B21